MLKFTALIEQFGAQGEKTGWTYIRIPLEISAALMPGSRKAFRVRGALDNYAIVRIATTPIGDGAYILPLNAAMRKGTGKRAGSRLEVALERDESDPVVPEELAGALADAPDALQVWNGLTGAHRNYFINWVNAAKGIDTRAVRVAATINAMLQGLDYGQTIHALKTERAALKRP